MLRKKSGGGSRVIEIGGAKEAPSRAGWLPPDAKGPASAALLLRDARAHAGVVSGTAHGATPAGTLDLRDARDDADRRRGAGEIRLGRRRGGAASSMCGDGYMGQRNAWLHVRCCARRRPDVLPDDYDEKPVKI